MLSVIAQLSEALPAFIFGPHLAFCHPKPEDIDIFLSRKPVEVDLIGKPRKKFMC